MKPLKFNREAAKQAYSRLYSDQAFDERQVELMLIRGELLARNEHFVKDWIEVQKHKEGKDLKERENALCKKWLVDSHGLYAMRHELDPVVQAYGGHLSRHHGFGYCTLVIDLRYPKKKIMHRIELEIDNYLRWYKEDFANGYIESNIEDPDERERAKQVPKRLSGYIVGYEDYLLVWDLRNEKKSFPEILKHLRAISGLPDPTAISIDTVKNWHRRACELIESGIPGFPPFPSP